jgi:ADP-ribose pyrophosphatase
MAKKSTKSVLTPLPQSDARVKVLSTKIVHEAPSFQVTTEQVVEPSGVTVRRDVIRHHGSVVVLPLDESREEPRVLLIRQYRYAAGQFLWELCAGHIEPGEESLAAAQRELGEETGYGAREWKQVLHFYVSPGFLQETMALYLARDLYKGKAHPEEDEKITRRFFKVEDAIDLVMKGKIVDAKTISGLLWLGQKLKIRQG